VQVIVDTCIWSLALRRQAKHLSPSEAILCQELENLVDEGRAQLIGPIRQEVLSGIRDAAQFNRLSKHLRAFRDEPVTTPDYELAAKLSNQCRAAGIAGSPVDFLLCAIATARNWPIFTCDGDFKVYGRILPIKFFACRG
jgi:predicted nucleic acid-binding protein